MTLFAKAAKIDTECAEAFSGLSRVCRIKKDMDQYEKLALKAAELHARHDNFEAARSIFHELKQHDPEVPNPFKLVARDMVEQGDLEGSVKSYQKAALADPEDTEVYSNLAQTYIKMGNVGKAEQSLVAGLRINEDNAEARKLYRGITGKRWSEHPESNAGQQRIAEEERKGTVRFWIPDLLAEVKGRGEHPSLIEMSVNSIGFSPLENPFKEGELLSLSILRIEEGQPNRLIKKLKARVAAQDAEIVSCRFEDISEEQRQELKDLIKSAQEAQRELKREEMLKKGEISFDLDMLFL